VKTVARQYGRYGWWKARMLMHHPGSLHWRQLLPALLVPALLVAVLGVLLDGGDQWRLLSVAYPAVILIGAVHAAGTRRKWAAAPWLVATFITMHVMWSAAFWASLLSLPFAPITPARAGVSNRPPN
jgi:ABC-type polysaccharide/polyol phosphate export permease